MTGYNGSSPPAYQGLLEKMGLGAHLQDYCKLHDHMVIKIGGEIAEHPGRRRAFVEDVYILADNGVRVQIVHGGKNAISAAMEEAGVEYDITKGRRDTPFEGLNPTERVTNPPVTRALRDINCRIVEDLDGHGLSVVSFDGVGDGRALYARQPPAYRTNGNFIGYPVGFREGVKKLIDASQVAVISPVSQDMDSLETSISLNVNADDAACAVSKETLARRLLYLSDVEGIKFASRDASGRILSDEAGGMLYEVVRRPTSGEVMNRILDSIASVKDGKAPEIGGGMIPKLECALEALAYGAGVGGVSMVDGRVEHAVLRETLGDGCGSIMLEHIPVDAYLGWLQRVNPEKHEHLTASSL